MDNFWQPGVLLGTKNVNVKFSSILC